VRFTNVSRRLAATGISVLAALACLGCCLVPLIGVGIFGSAGGLAGKLCNIPTWAALLTAVVAAATWWWALRRRRHHTTGCSGRGCSCAT
jgi:hypothetical protein